MFLPSALIAFAGLSAHAGLTGRRLDHLLSTSWQVADDVGPAAKLLLGFLLAVLFAGISRVSARSTMSSYLLNATAGLVAMSATLAFIPAALSRGFGVGLTGLRFDPASLPFYVVGGLVAGVAFRFSRNRCAATLRQPQRDT